MSIGRNINRLLRLADLIRTLEKGTDFDMSLWGEYKSEEYIPIIKKKKKAVRCKTTACIAGWATVVHPDLELRYCAMHLDFNVVNRKTGNRGGQAFVEAFGLPFYTAHYVCTGRHYEPAQAARVVEKVAYKLAEKHGYDIVEE